MLFPQFKANAGVKFAKMGHGPHSSKLVVICVFLLLFVLFYVLFAFVLFYVLFAFVLFYVLFAFVLFYVLFAFVLFYVLFVCECLLYHCHQVLNQLQLTNISFQNSVS